MPYIIAHRGIGNKYQPNTIKALKEALNDSRVDGVELDIRLTKDNKIVIIHDMLINRLSDGYGFVKNMTLNELKQHNFGNKEYPSQIDTLSEFLKNIKTNKIIVIEIKEETNNDKIIYVLLNELKKYKHLNIYICSFNYNIVKRLKKFTKHKVGIIVSNIINKNKDTSIFDFISINYLSYKNELMVWTINNKNKINTYNKNTMVVTDIYNKL